MKKTLNMDDPHMMLQHFCGLFYQFFNVHVLHFMRFYSNNTYTAFVNHQPWYDEFSANYMDLAFMESRIHLGFRLWKDIENSQASNAENAANKFGFRGLADIVKASTHEPGCYELYTFALDDGKHRDATFFYNKKRRNLVEFVASVEYSFINLVTKNTDHNQKIKLYNTASHDQTKRIQAWIKHNEYAHCLMGKPCATHLSVVR